LALAIGEVRRDGDHGLFEIVAEVLLGVALDFPEDRGRDLLGGVGFAVDLDPVLLAHVALDRLDGAIGVLDRLVLRGLADQALLVGERDHRGRRAVALAVDDDLRIRAFHHREGAVGGAEVDTEDLVARHLARWYCLRPVKSY
jgi:hypothetical protein